VEEPKGVQVFIIWGWKVVRTVLGSGWFYCPQCHSDTEYRHLALRRWFHIFFLPIIPLKRLGTLVECSQCQTAFTEQVLQSATLEVFEHHQGLANRAVVAHLVSQSAPTDSDALAVGLRALASAPGIPHGFDADALVTDISIFSDLDAVMPYLQPIAVQMTIEGREDFLRRMFVLIADLPHVSPDSDRAIEAVASALALSSAHLAGIRQSVQSGASAAGGDERS
jgi:hypothetical protein